MKRYRPAGALPVSITPEDARWKFSGLFVSKTPTTFLDELKGCEGALVPLNATELTVQVNEQTFKLNGRLGVFAGPTDWLYVPRNAEVKVVGEGEVALATAKSDHDFPAAYIPALNEVEVRGAGNATRIVRPFMHPDNFSQAHRLMAVEVITPDGNWSSYPPHRHDGVGNCAVNNEEIYYFRIGDRESLHGSKNGWGFHRTYSAPEDEGAPFDDSLIIRDGDIYLVDRGYHGPCVAAPGYPMYYLNVLAGEERTMAFCDDPVHAWVRESWSSQLPDSRAKEMR